MTRAQIARASSRRSRLFDVADAPVNDAPFRLIDDVDVRRGVVVYAFTNLYGCRIGDDTRIGPFVEIQRGAVIGARCKIQSHTFICDGVTIEDEVFVGHGVMFINDKTPARHDDGGILQTRGRLGAPAHGRRARRLARLGRRRARRCRIGAGRSSAPARW